MAHTTRASSPDIRSVYVRIVCTGLYSNSWVLGDACLHVMFLNLH